MNKTEFLTDMDSKLRSVESYLEAEATAANPSTVTRSLQQERAKPLIAALRERASAARADVNALRENTKSPPDPVAAHLQAPVGERTGGPAEDRAWETARTRLQEEWAEISAVLEQLEKPIND